MIKITGLTKVFTTDEIETTALNNIELHVKEGEFISVMGPSGCGKSTLLNIMGLLDAPTSGKYYFMNREVSGFHENQLTDLRKGNIGFIFQSFNLIDELTVFENVELPLLYLKQPSSKRNMRVKAVLDNLQLSNRKNHFPRQLSGGQQQRVAIARAIVTAPRLILADEPTGNLDSAHGEEVMSLLADLNREGTTVIMVTHSEANAERAHRIVQLFDGRLMAENIKRTV